MLLIKKLFIIIKLTNAQRTKVNDYFLKSQTKSLVEKRLLSYLNNNSNHLPMYAKPDMV
jgi:hypothetical protein